MAETDERPENVSGQPTEQPVSPEQPEVSKDAMSMAMLCHLLAIFTGFLGPLIIWLIKKEDAPFVNDHGKEALNFQITVLIAMVASGLLTFVCIGVFLVCEIFCWRDVTACFTMTYSAKDFDVFVILSKGKSWKTSELQRSRFWPKLG